MSDAKTSQEAISAAVSEIVIDQVTGKKWYRSKTIWANAVMALAFAVQAKYGFVIDATLQGMALSAINVWLRKITKEEIIW